MRVMFATALLVHSMIYSAFYKEIDVFLFFCLLIDDALLSGVE